MEKIVEAKKIKEANRIIFDRDSRSYSKKRRIRFDRKTAARLIQRYENIIGKRVQPVDRFLDIGCGNGLILLNLSSLGFICKSYGVDISLGMLKECKNNANNLGNDVFLAQGDVEHLPFKNNSFDLIIGHGILHHLPDIKMSFSEVYRLLKPKGICIFTEPTKIGSRIIASMLWIVWFIPMLIRRLTKTQMEKLVEINVFKPQDLEKEAKGTGFSNVYTKPFAGFISRIFYWTMDPISQRISSKHYHLIVEKMIDLLFIFDKHIFGFLIPKDWFDEVLIFLQKDDQATVSIQVEK